MDIDEAIKRLAFIKYLFNVGIEQTEKPEPFCWTSILTFHDAVELFLQLTAEYLNVKDRLKDISFMGYWSLINDYLIKIGKTELTQIISMERLNKARVNFKHYGTPPSKSAITGDFKVSVTNFFEENTMLVFDHRFGEISMLEVISYQRTKDDLKKAEDLLNQNKLVDSLDNVALAFHKLIDDYEDKKRDEWGYSLFSVGTRSYRRFSGASIQFDGLSTRARDYINWVGDSLEPIQEIVRIIGFGIDYKKYTKFKLLTPHLLKIVGGPYRIQRKERNPSISDVRFCIDFVVESALTLQEFDFEVEKA